MTDEILDGIQYKHSALYALQLFFKLLYHHFTFLIDTSII